MNPGCSLLVWSRNRGTLKPTTVSTYEWWEIGVQARRNIAISCSDETGSRR